MPLDEEMPGPASQADSSAHERPIKKPPDKAFLDSLVSVEHARKIIAHGVEGKLDMLKSFEVRDDLIQKLGHSPKNAFLLRKSGDWLSSQKIPLTLKN